MGSISLLAAAEMIARCERNRKKSSPDPYACPDAYAVPEQREVGKSGIHEDIENWLRSLGNKCFYIHSRTDRKSTCQNGTPDFVGFFSNVPDWPTRNPIVFAIECKKRGQKPTIEQLARLKQAECAGAITGIAHSLQEFKSILGMP